MSARTRIVGLALAAAATAALSACGPAATPSDPAGAVHPAASETATRPAAATTSPAPPPTSPAPPKPGAATKPVAFDDLLAGPVSIPAWHRYGTACPRGNLQLVKASGPMNRSATSSDRLALFAVVRTNLDQDPALETAALIACRPGEASIDQIVAFDRDAGGHIVTLGTVAEGIFWSLSPRAGGGVTADISDMQACCATPKVYEVHQIRGYAERGGRFVQVAGLTAFISHTRPVDLSIRLVSATWGGVHTGHRTGTITVKITNPSGYRTGDLVLADGTGAMLTSTAKVIRGIAAHSSATATFTVVLPAGFADAENAAVGVYERGSVGVCADPDYMNNSVHYPLPK